MLTESQKASLSIIRAKARGSLVDVPDRQQAENVFAETEGLAPALVQPLTEVPAALVVATIAAIPSDRDLSPELKEIIRVQRKACGGLLGYAVALRSDQLADIIDAALGEKPKNAPVQG